MERQPIYKPSELESLRQGEILTNVTQYKPTNINPKLLEENLLEVDPIIHPYAIIVTQDCDLDWDYRARFNESQNPEQNQPKLLNSIILCEIDTAEEIRNISDKNIMNSKEWELVKSHRHERFYFFERIPPQFDIKTEGLPELTADFKKVFGLDASFLYYQIHSGQAQRRTILTNPYLEHFSRRYQNFHGRIALPSQYESEKQG